MGGAQAHCFPPANASPAGWLILLQDKQQSAIGKKMHEQSLFLERSYQFFHVAEEASCCANCRGREPLPKTVAQCM